MPLRETRMSDDLKPYCIKPGLGESWNVCRRDAAGVLRKVFQEIDKESAEDLANMLNLSHADRVAEET